MKTNFSDIQWVSTQITHVGEFDKKCIIGVPVYKDHLSEYEIASFAQLCKIIKESYEICLIYPNELNISEYQYISKKFNIKLATLACSKEYFKSLETYSYLCETTQFYQCFSEYEYLFIYQLDGWIFTNLLEYYIDLNVDYIGSPWKEGSFRFLYDTIGNGGVSLRRVQKFIEVCGRLKPSDFFRQYADLEDLFFCKTLRAEVKFNFPTLKNAANFSLTLNWSYFMEKYTKNHLPMCLHGWYKEYTRFKKYMNIEQYKDIMKDYQPVCQPIVNQVIEEKKNIEKPKNIKQIENNKEEIKMGYGYDEFIRSYYGLDKKDNNVSRPINEISIKKPNQKIFNYINYICEQDVPFNIENSEKERIIITLTSWKKRISNVPYILERILNNTLLPDEIIINLAISEFQNRENDLPKNLLDLINIHKNIHINWLKNDTKVWKKLIPTIYLCPNDIIISIDDDFEYPNNLIETLYNEYLKYDKKYPISGNKCKFKNIQCHCGCASLVKKEFIEPFFYILNKNIIDGGSDDIFYTYCATLNKKEYKQSSIEFFTNMKAYNEIFSYSNILNAANLRQTYDACENSYKNSKFLNIALCAIAKNENLYIREWVEWYKNLGIKKIFLYDNNELNGEHFEEVIDDYIKSGYVQVIDVRGTEKGRIYENGINLQPKCYTDCYEKYGKDFAWMAFFDIDEFLVFKNEQNIFTFLNQSKFKNIDTVLIPWEHYDDNNLYDYDIRPVMERFTHKSNFGFHCVKSIVRTNKKIIDKSMENLIHCFKVLGSKICFSNGDYLKEYNSHNWYLLQDRDFERCEVVLNHYKTKTITEYLYRHLGRYWGTGEKNTKNPKKIENCSRDFFQYNQRTPIKEEIIKIFKKNNNIIQYYKKLKSINVHKYIATYDNYINNIQYDKINKKENIGIITLTTWKARINTVYITLCNLINTCSNFHIVLVLSSDEFPQLEKELPQNIKKLIENNLIEILWVKENYKSCKKLIFTIEKYKNSKLPIITADDDCLYITNYAQELYNIYKQKKLKVIRYNMYNIKSSWQFSQGPCTLYAPSTFTSFLKYKNDFLNKKMENDDDIVITEICKKEQIHIDYLYRGHIFPFIFINEINATNDNTKNIDFINCYV